MSAHQNTPAMPIIDESTGHVPAKAMLIALVVGIAGLVVRGFGFVSAGHGDAAGGHHGNPAFVSYLFGWLTILGAALGAMAFMMIPHMSGGAWGFMVRRIGEAAALTLLPIMLLGLPLILGASDIFPFADPAAANEPLVKHRASLIAPGPVLIRSVIFFAGWILIGSLLAILSRRHDKLGGASLRSTMRKLSVFGFIFYFVTMSLASFDWIASREVDWYSTTFGLTTCVGQAATGLCVMIITLAFLRNTSPLKQIMTEDRVHDLGNLLLTATVFWSYVAFTQYLVIWIGNPQEDMSWFIHRARWEYNPGWTVIGAMMMIFHFGVPFILLLFQGSKRKIHRLAMVAGLVLVMRVLDVLWMVIPSNPHDMAKATPLHWFDPFAVIGLGGIWVALFLFILNRRPLVPRAYNEEIVALQQNSHAQVHGELEHA